MRKNDEDRKFAVEFACRSGLWAPVTFSGAKPGDVFDAYDIRCVKCGHTLKANQGKWRWVHETKCATPAESAEAARRWSDAMDAEQAKYEADRDAANARLRALGVNI